MNKANGDKGLRTNRGNEWARGVNKESKVLSETEREK